MRKTLIAVLAMSCAGTGVAFAQTTDADNERSGGREMRTEMRELIRGDGLDLETLTGMMQERGEARFGRLDADGDGTISLEEFTASVEDRAARLFERMGPNEDGVVTRSERPRWAGHRGGPRHHHRAAMRGMSAEDMAEHMRERAGAMFDAIDAEGEGVITREQFVDAAGERAEQRAERMQERPRRGMRGHHGRGGPGSDRGEGMREMRSEMRDLMRGDGMDLEALTGLMQTRAESRFEALDTDGDGVISAEEYAASIEERAEAMFARMDRNEDGLVTAEDRERGHGKRGWRSHDRGADSETSAEE